MTDTNTQTQPQKSVMDCVKEFIAANPDKPFTMDDLSKAYPNKPKPQLANAVWVLRMKGKLTRATDGTLSVLTGVNAIKPEVKTKTKRKTKRKIKVVKPTAPRPQPANNSVSEAEYNRLMEKWVNLRQQHEDALAIIRYLENKLYVALQLAAQNGIHA